MLARARLAYDEVVMRACVAGGAAAAGAGGLAGEYQLRELRAPHHAGLSS